MRRGTQLRRRWRPSAATGVMRRSGGWSRSDRRRGPAARPVRAVDRYGTQTPRESHVVPDSQHDAVSVPTQHVVPSGSKHESRRSCRVFSLDLQSADTQFCLPPARTRCKPSRGRSRDCFRRVACGDGGAAAGCASRVTIAAPRPAPSNIRTAARRERTSARSRVAASNRRSIMVFLLACGRRRDRVDRSPDRFPLAAQRLACRPVPTPGSGSRRNYRFGNRRRLGISRPPRLRRKRRPAARGSRRSGGYSSRIDPCRRPCRRWRRPAAIHLPFRH